MTDYLFKGYWSFFCIFELVVLVQISPPIPIILVLRDAQGCMLKSLLDGEEVKK